MKRLIKRSHFDNVNALRFLAFIAIFLSHCFITNNQHLEASTLFTDLRQFTSNLAQAAFSFIFILTGFLNTWTVFEERFIYKKMNTLRFYMRRILTIVPLYILIFLIGEFVMPGITTGLESADSGDGPSAWAYFTFTQNFGYEGAGTLPDAVQGNMWSIAVYMQFVIFWPLLMDFFRRNEVWLFGLLLLGFLGSAWFLSGSNSFQYNTLNFFCEFFIGAYIAYFSFFKYPFYGWLKSNTRRTVGFVYLIFFLFLVFRERILYAIPPEIPAQLLFIAERILICAALGYFLFEQNFSNNSILKAAKLKFLNFPGKLVYGMYVYHTLGILAGYTILNFMVDQQTAWSVFLLEPLLSLLVTLVMAVFSYEYLEKKFVRRKKNYQPTREYNPMGISDVKTKPA